MKKLFIAIYCALVLVIAFGFIACKHDSGDTPNRWDKLYKITIDPDSAEGNPGRGFITVNTNEATYKTTVRVYFIIDEGFTVDYITYNGLPAEAGSNYYSFVMPEKKVTLKLGIKPGGFEPIAIIYKGGPGPEGKNLTFISEQNKYDKDEKLYNPEPVSPYPSSLSIVTEAPGEGRGDGRVGEAGTADSAIKIDLDSAGAEIVGTTNKDWYALRLNFDPIQLDDADALSLYIRTPYDDTTYNRRKAGVRRVAFGDEYDDVKQEWTGFSIQYQGEAPAIDSLNNPIIPVDDDSYHSDKRNRWTRIIVPIPKHGEVCKNIMLYFLPWQVIPYDSDLVYYIDKVEFVRLNSENYAEDKYLESVILPVKGEIPGGGMQVDIDVLLQDTFVYYRLDNVRYTLYGREQRPGSAIFTNKFRLTNMFNIQYNAPGLTITGDKISSSDYNKKVSLYVTFDGVRSMITDATTFKTGYNVISGDMEITVRNQTVKPTGKVILEDFENLQQPNDHGGAVILPLYWGGTAGDAQCYHTYNLEPEKWILNCFMKNISKDSFWTSGVWIGFPQDDWYIFGSQGLNHDLTNLTKIVVRAQIVKDSTWTFALESGYIGVPTTLNDRHKRVEYRIPFTSADYEYANYEFLLQDFADEGVDLTMVTGFNLYTEKSYNTSAQALAGWQEFEDNEESAGTRLYSIHAE